MVKNLPANAGDMGSIPGTRGSHKPRSNNASMPEILKSMRPRAHALQTEKPRPLEAV